jgi:hypothetical protein
MMADRLPDADERITLSLPGYDKKQSMAVVTVRIRRDGGSCAIGYAAILVRERNQWRVVRRINEWIS